MVAHRRYLGTGVCDFARKPEGLQNSQRRSMLTTSIDVVFWRVQRQAAHQAVRGDWEHQV